MTSAADEAARDVRVNRLGGVESGLTVSKRPRPRLRVADREERDQPERFLQANDDVVEGRRAGAKLRGLVVGELRELHLERAVDPVRRSRAG